MSPLRAAKIITIGILPIALSSAAQDSPESSGARPEQDAVSNAHALLIQAAGILEGSDQPTNEYTWGDRAFAAARAKDVSLAIRAANRSHKS